MIDELTNLFGREAYFPNDIFVGVITLSHIEAGDTPDKIRTLANAKRSNQDLPFPSVTPQIRKRHGRVVKGHLPAHLKSYVVDYP